MRKSKAPHGFRPSGTGKGTGIGKQVSSWAKQRSGVRSIPSGGKKK